MAFTSVEDQLADSLIDRLPLLGLGLGNRHLGEYISVDQVIFHRSFQYLRRCLLDLRHGLAGIALLSQGVDDHFQMQGLQFPQLHIADAGIEVFFKDGFVAAVGTPG